MRFAAFEMALLALVACAGPAHPPPPAQDARSRARAQGRDELLALAAELPPGGDRCVLARPAPLSAARRALIVRASQAEPFAWLPELAISAYASVDHADRDGPSARATVIAFGIPAAQARALLDTRAGVALDWSETPAACNVDACPLHARFIGEHRARFERGAFPIAARPGAEATCLALFEDSPEALEVASVRSGPNADFELNGLPVRSNSVIRPAADGVHVIRNDLLHSVIEAEAALEDDAAAGLLLGPGGALGSNMRREQHGAAVLTEYDVLWEDLELARDDDARAAAAEREAEARERARPAAETPALAREEIESELGYRLDLARRAPAGERDAELSTARALLERALERTPEDEGLALLLAELLVTELHEPTKALVLAQRFIGLPGARPRWLVVRRHAAALGGEAALADRLVEDGLVPRRKALPVAEDILLRMQQGMGYEPAERAAVEAAR